MDVLQTSKKGAGLLKSVTRVISLLLAGSPAWGQCGILTWEQLRPAQRTLPYVLRLAARTGELLMFGAQHTRDPQHTELPELERLWREFRPDIGFSEGGIRPLVSSRDEAVVRYGEPGLLRFLADRDQVQLRNLEPPEGQEAAWLAPQFEPGQVKLFYVLRFLNSVSPTDPRAALDSVRRRQGLEGVPNSVNELEMAARGMLPEFDWRSVPNQWFDPTRSDTFLNAIARRLSDYRNCHMVPLIVEAVRSGKRVLVVVGGTHVIMQEPALRAALESR